MAERVKWLYLLVGLLVGGGAVLAFEHFPGGGQRGDRLGFRFEEGRTYRVQNVFDGDTIVIEPGIRLRYPGIDAPETAEFVKLKRPFAFEAKEANERLVANRPVRLIVNGAHFDRYGRLLASVEVQDPETGKWLDVEEELLKAGLAERWRTAGAIPNESRLRGAEESAKRERLGVWSDAGAEAFPKDKYRDRQ